MYVKDQKVEHKNFQEKISDTLFDVKVVSNSEGIVVVLLNCYKNVAKLPILTYRFSLPTNRMIYILL